MSIPQREANWKQRPFSLLKWLPPSYELEFKITYLALRTTRSSTERKAHLHYPDHFTHTTNPKKVEGVELLGAL